MKRGILIALFAAFLGATLLFYWGHGYLGSFVLGQNIVYVGAPILAALAGLWLVRVHGWGGKQSHVFLLLTLGILCWAIGEALWVYYEHIVKTDPFPSPADYFYLAAYPLLFGGLMSEYSSSRAYTRKLDPVIGFLLGLVASLAALIIIYFGIILPFDPETPFLENLIAIGYSVGDMVVLLSGLMILILAWKFKGGNYMQFYLYAFFALILTLVADLGFAMYTDEYIHGSWWHKNSLDTLWIMGYLYWAVAFSSFAVSLQRVQDRFTKKGS